MESFAGGFAGYGATKAAMTKTLEQIGGKMALGLMMGGGKKRKMSNLTKRISKSRIKSIKKFKKIYTKHRKKRRVKRKKKMDKAHKHIIESIEYGKPLSKDHVDSLSPSMKKFLKNIDTETHSGSTIRFSDFKSTPNKKKTKSRPRTRGGNRTRRYR